MTTDPARAIDEGSPALAMLLLALGGAIAGRALVGRGLLARARRTPTRAAPDDEA
jgi:hypothetical protein